jgi:protease-4
VKTLADGRVYTAQQAKENGLVDELGYVEDAVKLAKEKAGVKKAKVIMYGRPWGAKSNVYAAAGAAAQPQINLVNINVPDLSSLGRPEFLYLWNGRQ